MIKTFILPSLVYLAFAIPLSLMDLKKFRISLPVLFVGFFVLALCRFIFSLQPALFLAKNLAFALFSSFLIYFCTRVLSADGLGFGDIFFGMFSSLYTGFYMNITATVFAALIGVLYYLFLAAIQKFKKKQFAFKPIFAIPFVPFITAGSILAMLLFYVLI